MATSAYIHIPFCKSKCKYCSFVSYTNQNSLLQKNYINTLLKEINYYYKKEPLKTLYIGGGTPSLLEIDSLKKILNCFKFSQNPEITIEVNPETVDYTYLAELYNSGFNRISIGVQSFNDNILKTIGRIHNAETALKAVKSAQKAGFKNINTDFIYGLPEQSTEDFINDLKIAADMDVQHISLYGLKIEEGCEFYKKPPENIADDDTQADMYLMAIETLEKYGYKHYEISNFACCGFESRHNLNYWEDEEYYGFGAAAHGYIDNRRYANYTNLQQYKTHYETKQYIEDIDKQKHLEEMIFLGFRKADGINTARINETFSINFEEYYKKIIEKYLCTGHLLKTNTGYKLSNEGFLISNIILSDFIEC